MFKSLSILSATLLSLTFAGAPVLANNTESAHVDLLNSVVDAGVRVYINPAHCFLEDAPNGFYVSQSRVLVVCQDNRETEGEIVDMTANDLDTIRHEVHHVVQDCKDGIGDNSLKNFFSGEGELAEFLELSSLTEYQLNRIVSAYTENGADIRTVLLELEAFAVAADVDASDITGAIQTFCPIN